MTRGLRRGQPSMAVLQRTLAANRQRLRSLPNVSGIGFGLKVTNKKLTRRRSLVVYVKKKVWRIERRQRIPTRLRARGPKGTLLPFFVPVDVQVERSKFQTFALSGADPIRGWSIGRAAFAYRSVQGATYVLTNSHVAAPPNHSPYGAPVLDLSQRVVGRTKRACVLRSDSLNYVDAALLQPTASVDLYRLGSVNYPVVGLWRFQIGHRRYWYWGNTQWIECVVTAFYAEQVAHVRIGGVPVGFTKVWELRAIEGQPERGHSGSLIVRNRGDGLLACGLLFAGDERTREILACSIQSTLWALGQPFAASDGRTAEDVRPSWR